MVDSFSLSPMVRTSENFLKGEGLTFEVKIISNEKFNLLHDKKSIGTHFFDDYFANQFGQFKFSLDPNLVTSNGVQLLLIFKDPTALTHAYQERFKVDLVNIKSTVVKLRLKDEVPERGIALMNKIINILSLIHISEPTRPY